MHYPLRGEGITFREQKTSVACNALLKGATAQALILIPTLELHSKRQSQRTKQKHTSRADMCVLAAFAGRATVFTAIPILPTALPGPAPAAKA